MNFSEALQLLKDGMYLTRAEWGAAFVFIENEEFTKSINGNHCEEWTPAHADLLAEDWSVAA